MYKLYQKAFSRQIATLLCFVVVLSTFMNISTANAAVTLNQPQNLAAPNKTSTSVTLVWDAVYGATGYDIYKGTSYGGFAASNTKEITGLTPNTSYTFSVAAQKALDGGGLDKSPTSVEITVTTEAASSTEPEPEVIPPLTPPNNLKITAMTDSSVTLSWGSSPTATGYDLYANDGWAGFTTENSKTIEGLTPGVTYKFRVAAQDWTQVPLRVSVPSSGVILKLGELAAPTDLSVVTANRTSVSLGWAPTAGTVSYDVYMIDTTVTGATYVVRTTDSNRFVASGLIEGDSYSFKVFAKNGALISPASTEVIAVPGKNYNIITYYTAWSIYGRTYSPTDIDVSKVTHINYAFADICWNGHQGNTGAGTCQNADVPLQSGNVQNGEIVVGDAWADVNIAAGIADPVDCNLGKCGNFYKLRQMKEQNPGLKTLISVGGWSWSNRFSDMAATEVTRRNFANSAVKFVRTYGFDGVDIDWEYPVHGGMDNNSKSPEDKENFKLLVQTLREALDAAGHEDGKYYLTSIAAGASEKYVEDTNLASSSAYLDFVNIMTYDFHGVFEEKSGHNAPLYFDKSDPTTDARMVNVDGAVTSFLNHGVPNYKLVLGVPFYGKGWKGCNAAGNGQYQTCLGSSESGSWENGTYDISDLENNYVDKNGYVRFWNDNAKIPYLFNADNKTFITYEDKASIMYKTSYIKSQNLAGAMSWEVSGDRNKTLQTQLSNDLPTQVSPGSSVQAAPINAVVANKGIDFINIVWGAAPNATGYDVFVNRAWVGYTIEAKYHLTGLAPGTSYKIEVIAIHKVGNLIEQVSIMSNAISTTTNLPVTTPPAPGSTSTSSPSPSATPTPSAKPTPQVVNADSLKNSKDGKVTVKVANDAIAVLLPLQAATEIGKNNLELKAENFTVFLPNEVLTSIQNLLSGKEAEGASISFEANRLPANEVISLIDGADAKQASVKAVSEVYEFKLSVIKKDGNSISVSVFEKPIVLTLKVNGNPNKDLLGIYYLGNKGEMEYVGGNFKDGFVTAEVTHFSKYAVLEYDKTFEDVTAGHWASSAIKSLAAKHIVSGITNTEFAPQANVTRAQFAALLVRALGVKTEGQASFADTKSDAWYSASVATASKLGIVYGRGGNTFAPDATITREEMAVMIVRALNVKTGKEAAAGQSLTFADKTRISAWAVQYVAAAAELGLVQGRTDNQFAPDGLMTRAESAQVIYNLLQK